MINDICVLTDTHFGFDNNSEILLESSLNFFKNVLVPYLEKHKIKDIFILGDIFDSRTSINTRIHKAVYDLFNDTLGGFKIWVIIGNHDTYYNSTTEVHSLKFLEKFSNVELFEKPEVIKIQNNVNILMVPWFVDENEMNKIISESNASIVMGHFDISGFNFNKFVTSKNGTSPELFLNYKTIFSGHFHTRSVRDIGNSKFIYVGTPYQLTRADMDEERGFLIYNLHSKKHRFVSNPVSMKFINIEYPNTFTEEMVKGNKVDVVVKYNHETYNPEDYVKYIERIEKFKPVKITPQYIDTTELESNLILSKDFNTNSVSSIPDLIKGYIEALNLNSNDKEEVFKILIRLYGDANGGK